jgi:NTP pyrophosphatase (non-canonical NTP hydrolase)
MTERERVFESLGAEINEINHANGWNVLTPDDWPGEATGDIYKLGTALALIHSEVSEALEAARKRDPENFQDEMADIVIRVLDCTHGLGIDISGAITAKLEKNRHRGFRHGGKAV